jgi:hypothetical protein
MNIHALTGIRTRDPSKYCCTSLNTRNTKKLTNEALQNRDFVIDAHAVKKLLSSFATWRFISSVDSERYCSLPCYRYSLTYTLSTGVHAGLPSGTVRVSYNFVYVSCPHFLRDCCIYLFCLWFCYYTTILRGNSRKAIVSASFLQHADI